MSKRTPGPWTWKEWAPRSSAKTHRSLVGSNNEPVLWDGEYDQGSRNGADDELIAAAPELLALLRAAEWGHVEQDHDGYMMCPICGEGFNRWEVKAGRKPMAEHKPDCRLAMLLDRLK